MNEHQKECCFLCCELS